MKVIIYGGTLNREYSKSFYYLKNKKKIDRVRYLGTNPIYYTLSKLKNFRNYTFKDIFNSYIAPFILFLTKDILVIGIPPYSYKIIFPLILTKLKKKIIYFHSWPYFDNPHMGIIKPNSLKLKLWNSFLSKVICIISTHRGLKALKKMNYEAYHIPHSINLNLFKSIKKANKKIKVLYVGRLIEEKGIKELLEIFSKFDPNKVEFIFVGKGSLTNYVKSKQKELPLTYLGHISDRKKIVDVYAKSDIFVLNSYKTDKWEEFFGIVLLEAMALGLPIVSTDCVGPKEIIINGKNGFLVKQKNNEEFYKALKKLIDNPKLRSKMGRYGKKFVDNYSIEKISLKLYKVLSKCQNK
ncbi:glycosyltransferase family 4 protein [bacterium]|nr:glycosyltransferase family 4 protein [bacterium]